MTRVLVPIADGFEEMEAVVLIDVLRRAGFEVVTAGLKSGVVTGAHSLILKPDLDLDTALKKDYDMLVLPGGQPGTDHLRSDRRVIELVKKMDQKQSLIGAICAAPLVLRDAGIMTGRMLTSYPGMEAEFKDSRYCQTRVVVDGHLVTGRGPGAALEFALKLVEIVQGEARAVALAQKMVVAG